MQHAEAVFGDQRAAILPHAAHGLGDPHGVAAEQRVVAGGAQVPRQAQLDDEVVHDLLGLLLAERALGEIPLEVDIQEGGDAPQAHGRAVLLLDGRQIAEIQPLHRFARIACGRADIHTVNLRHGFQLFQKVDLAVQFFCQTDVFLVHVALA